MGSADVRVWLVTASGRSLPALMCWRLEATLAKNSGTCPAMTSVIAGPPPLYGTWSRSTLARCSNSTPDRCCAEPLPDEANATVPGFCFASASTSLTFVAGKAGLATSTLG
ncbi:hypothetical protein D3C81_1694420 [compost metagenome]